MPDFDTLHSADSHTLDALYLIGRKFADQTLLEDAVQFATDQATKLTGAEFGAFFYNIENEAGDTYTLYTISGVPKDTFSQFPMPRKTKLFAPTFSGEGVVRSDDIIHHENYGQNAPHNGMPYGHLPVRSYLSVPVASKELVAGTLFFGHSKPGMFTETSERVALAIAAQAAIGIENARLSEKLKRQAHLFETALSNTPDLVYIFDCDGRFTYANRALLAMWGRTWEESIGKTCLELGYEPWHAAMHQREIEEVLRTKQPIRGEVPFNGTNGRRIYDYIFSPVLDAEGKVEAIAGTTRDVTDRKIEEESMVEARNAAEAANIAKTDFLTNMSHEIRTPMNAIIGLSYILSRSELNPKQKECVNTLQMSADSLLALINDLLDISKIETGHVELESIPFKFGALLNDVASMLVPRLKEKQLEFKTDDEAMCGQAYMGDPARIRQIMLNLCSNAVKFTEKGVVTILLTREKIDDQQDSICIAVKDSGIGIAENKLSTIFEKFVQADTSINRKYGGTGLGLAITKTLTEVMGGTIDVQSKQGEGSTFTIHLPLPRAAQENQTAA